MRGREEGGAAVVEEGGREGEVIVYNVMAR
jgi:hypothetical protein